jgi:hypothetical protein
VTALLLPWKIVNVSYVKNTVNTETQHCTHHIVIHHRDSRVVIYMLIISPDLDYFSLSIDPETKTCLVAVVQNLPQDVLDKAEDIILNLEATTSGSKAGVSVLVITLPKTAASEIPKFSRVYYIGKYEVDSDQNAKVTLKSPITIASPEDQTVTVNFSEGE